MITITIQGYLTFKGPVGKRQVSLTEGSSLRGLMDRLRQDLGAPYTEQAFNEAGELSEHIAVLLNGVHYRHLPGGLNTLLKDGDQISIFPPLTGG